MTARSDAALNRIIAYHEAGHAVAHVHLKLRLKKVYLKDPKGGGGGRTCYRGFTPKLKATWRRWHEDMVVALFAGPLAERRYAPRSDWRYGMTGGGSTSDLEQIHRSLEKLGYYGEARDAQQGKLEARAKALVKELWPEIQIVAAVLLERKVLSGAEVRKLLKWPHRGRTCWNVNAPFADDEAGEYYGG